MRRAPLAVIGAIVLIAMAGCAAVASLQNEFVFPNAAEGPMARPTPPGATEYWLETADGARVEILALPAARRIRGSARASRDFFPRQLRLYRDEARISAILYRTRHRLFDGRVSRLQAIDRHAHRKRRWQKTQTVSTIGSPSVPISTVRASPRTGTHSAQRLPLVWRRAARTRTCHGLSLPKCARDAQPLLPARFLGVRALRQ